MPIKRTAQGGYEVSVCVRGQRAHRRLPPGEPASSAKRLESELRIALERAAPARKAVVPGDPPMLEVLGLYTEEAEHLRSPDTAKHHAARIVGWAESYRASEARACAAAFVKDCRGQYAPATINRSLGALKRGLRIAFDRGLTREDYSALIRRLPENNQRDLYLDIPEVQEIAKHASANVRAAIWIALLTGCRRGEVLKIVAADVGEESILIRSGNTKTLKTRTVPIVPALRPWLSAIPLPINYEGLKTGFRRAREAAAMPEVHFHDLRHSCATILLGLEVPLDVVRDILGHSTIKTTERYAHALVHRQRAGLEKLGALADLHQPRTPEEKEAA